MNASPPRRPTRRQLKVLRAYIAAGSIAAAAYELGIGGTTVRQHQSGLYRRTGCLKVAQAAYVLGLSERTSPRPADAERERGDRLIDAWPRLPLGLVDPRLEAR